MQYDHISTFATVATGESIPFRANGNKSAIDSHTTMATYNRAIFMV